MTESARLALITGSSRGIGKAIAIDLAATGVDILATGRDETRLHNVKKEIEGFGVEAHVVSADLGTDQGINKLHKYLEANDLSGTFLSTTLPSSTHVYHSSILKYLNGKEL